MVGAIQKEGLTVPGPETIGKDWQASFARHISSANKYKNKNSCIYKLCILNQPCTDQAQKIDCLCYRELILPLFRMPCIILCTFKGLGRVRWRHAERSLKS